MAGSDAGALAESASWCAALSMALEQDGLAVLDETPLTALAPALAADARGLERVGRFRNAGVGRGASFRVRPEIRDDRVLWWDPERCTRAMRLYRIEMERLRQHLNQTLWLGLARFETHFAVYPAGARYQTHLDRFASAPHRMVSLIFYLNAEWQAEDGGHLRLYLDVPESEPWRDILPIAGRLVAFESGRFHHEVRPGRRSRRSVVGWLTRGGPYYESSIT
ncbi:MAG TPA: 2OG-Fe(II) oxygenase [Myxococcota bacterium]|nr:2OG-Fe(II) oxygenase [Myxococcota bacterium]